MSKLWILLILPLIVCPRPLPKYLADLLFQSQAGTYKKIIHEPIVVTNGHIALADEKKIIQLELQALQLWYEIWNQEPTVEQNQQKEEISKKLQEATKVVETCPFEEYTDQTQFQAEVVALIKITPSKKKPKLEILTTYTDYDFKFYYINRQPGPTELEIQCWEYQAQAETYRDFQEKVSGYEDLYKGYPHPWPGESNDEIDEGSEEQEELDNFFINDTIGRQQLNLPFIEDWRGYEATQFWADVARDGGPILTVPSKNLKRHYKYQIAMDVTFKGKNKLLAQVSQIFFQTFNKSSITKIAQTTDYVTIIPRIWTPFTEYLKGKDKTTISQGEAERLYEDGVEITWNLGDAKKIYILVVKDDIDRLFGFDWKTQKDRAIDNFCFGFALQLQCPESPPEDEDKKQNDTRYWVEDGLPTSTYRLSIISSAKSGNYTFEVSDLRSRVNMFLYQVSLLWEDGTVKSGFNWFYVEGPDINSFADVCDFVYCGGNGQCDKGVCICEDSFFGASCSIKATQAPATDSEREQLYKQLNVETKDFNQEQWTQHNVDVAAYAILTNLGSEKIAEIKSLLSDSIDHASSVSELSSLLDGVLNVGKQERDTNNDLLQSATARLFTMIPEGQNDVSIVKDNLVIVATRYSTATRRLLANSDGQETKIKIKNIIEIQGIPQFPPTITLPNNLQGHGTSIYVIAPDPKFKKLKSQVNVYGSVVEVKDLKEGKHITICIPVNGNIDPSTLEAVYYDSQTKSYSTEGLTLSEDQPSSTVCFETSHLLGEMALQITSDTNANNFDKEKDASEENDDDSEAEEDSEEDDDQDSVDIENENEDRDEDDDQDSEDDSQAIKYSTGFYISLVQIAMILVLN